MNSLAVDTHAFVWYLSNSPRLSATARQAIRSAIDNGYPVYVSAITIAEVIYLVEKGRLTGQQLVDLLAAVHRSDSGFVVLPFDLATAEALSQIPRQLVPDMPDRIIAATASFLNLPLVTVDAQIRATSVQTIW